MVAGLLGRVVCVHLCPINAPVSIEIHFLEGRVPFFAVVLAAVGGAQEEETVQDTVYERA